MSNLTLGDQPVSFLILSDDASNNSTSELSGLILSLTFFSFLLDFDSSLTFSSTSEIFTAVPVPELYAFPNSIKLCLASARFTNASTVSLT